MFKRLKFSEVDRILGEFEDLDWVPTFFESKVEDFEEIGPRGTVSCDDCGQEFPALHKGCTWFMFKPDLPLIRVAWSTSGPGQCKCEMEDPELKIIFGGVEFCENFHSTPITITDCSDVELVTMKSWLEKNLAWREDAEKTVYKYEWKLNLSPRIYEGPRQYKD